MSAKIDVFKKLDKICRPDAIFTTNTSVNGWLRELKSYEIGRAARAEVRKTLEYIQEEGGLNFNRLVHLMGNEAAGELRKKLGNFYFTSKKAFEEGRGLPLDVLAEALGMDENGLVAFLEGIEGGRLKKPSMPA